MIVGMCFDGPTGIAVFEWQFFLQGCFMSCSNNRFVFFLFSAFLARGMSCISPQIIRSKAAKEMSVIFWFHMRIMAVLVGVQFVMSPTAMPMKFTLAMAAFCNVFCLADRFWDIQLRSLVYWHPFCQCVFLVSRLFLMTISIIIGAMGVRVGWDLMWSPRG